MLKLGVDVHQAVEDAGLVVAALFVGLQKIQQKNSKCEINSENNEYFSPITENNNKKILPNSKDFNNNDLLDISSIEVINLMGLNEFSAEEVVDAIFSNESLRKITFPIFKIKLQVIFTYFNNFQNSFVLKTEFLFFDGNRKNTTHFDRSFV